MRESACAWERESPNPPPPFGSSFYMFFLPLGLPYVNWASQECCLYYRGPYSSPRTFVLFLEQRPLGFPLPRLLTTAVLDSFSPNSLIPGWGAMNPHATGQLSPEATMKTQHSQSLKKKQNPQAPSLLCHLCTFAHFLFLEVSLTSNFPEVRLRR